MDPRRLARRVKLVALDVDGVMTDGGIYLGAVDGAPMEFKRYDIQDGLGIKFLQQAGLHVAIVTGRVSEGVRLRAAELGVADVAQDSQARKLPALREICAARGVTLDEVAFVGDDWPDVAVLRAVGLPVAVANAVPEVLALAAVRLERRGGHGAVREFAEWLLRERGEWQAVTERYVAERADAMVAR
ncbi:MAG: HAD-IIIA family hydrolase [Gemmatimonadetes bacterium]|nr:HAD-IIIA family hydrolase [Gemmatimonadota bacterium]